MAGIVLPNVWPIPVFRSGAIELQPAKRPGRPYRFGKYYLAMQQPGPPPLLNSLSSYGMAANIPTTQTFLGVCTFRTGAGMFGASQMWNVRPIGLLGVGNITHKFLGTFNENFPNIRGQQYRILSRRVAFHHSPQLTGNNPAGGFFWTHSEAMPYAFAYNPTWRYFDGQAPGPQTNQWILGGQNVFIVTERGISDNGFGPNITVNFASFTTTMNDQGQSIAHRYFFREHTAYVQKCKRPINVPFGTWGREPPQITMPLGGKAYNSWIV